MDLPRNAHYDEGDRIIPNDVVLLADKPEVKLFARESKLIHMKDRQPLGSGTDEMGNKLDIMVTLSTDQEDPEDSRVAAVVRDNRGSYGVIKNDGTFEALSPHGNGFQKFELEGASFGVLRDERRDSLSMTPNVGSQVNGQELTITMAMFPPEQSQ